MPGHLAEANFLHKLRGISNFLAGQSWILFTFGVAEDVFRYGLSPFILLPRRHHQGFHVDLIEIPRTAETGTIMQLTLIDEPIIVFQDHLQVFVGELEDIEILSLAEHRNVNASREMRVKLQIKSTDLFEL